MRKVLGTVTAIGSTLLCLSTSVTIASARPVSSLENALPDVVSTSVGQQLDPHMPFPHHLYGNNGRAWCSVYPAAYGVRPQKPYSSPYCQSLYRGRWYTSHGVIRSWGRNKYGGLSWAWVREANTGTLVLVDVPKPRM